MDRIRHVLLSSQALSIVLNLGLFDDGVLVRAQHQSDKVNTAFNFQPSLAVALGILAVMVFATLILLIYAKFCYQPASAFPDNIDNSLTRSRQFSGIDKTVIKSLPFFQFSSLRGSRAGLECSVCLSMFEDVEILRLLPNCKHAFHINCIDQWLERHSTCPLCRHRVSPNDPSIFAYSNSMRLLSSSRSERTQDPVDSPEIYIEREEESTGGSSTRFNIRIGSSFRKFFRGSTNGSNSGSGDEESSIIREEGDRKTLHKYNHRIVVSDIVFQHRWSDVSLSDLMFLKSEMLDALSIDSFSALKSGEGNPTLIDHTFEDDHQTGKIKEELDRKRQFESKFSSTDKTDLISSGPSRGNRPPEGKKRSKSEIMTVPRFGDLNTKEERRQLWLPIARRTVQWFANMEKIRSPGSHPEDSPNITNTGRQTPDSAAA